MRAQLIALSVLALAAPAVAQTPEAEVADRLNDPIVQEGVARSLSGALAALLDFRVGALERAIDPWSGARRSDTLRDRVSPDFEDRIEDDARRATRAMGVMADEFALLMPELRAAAGRIGRRIDEAGGRWDERAYED